MMRSALLVASLLVLCACEGRAATVTGEPVYLYETGSACISSAHAGPEDTIRGRKLMGVSATLDVGTRLMVIGEELGKDFACWRVKSGGTYGYVLMGRRIVIKPTR